MKPKKRSTRNERTGDVAGRIASRRMRALAKVPATRGVYYFTLERFVRIGNVGEEKTLAASCLTQRPNRNPSRTRTGKGK